MSRADAVDFDAGAGTITSSVELIDTGPAPFSVIGGPGGAAVRSSLRAWSFSSMDMPSADAVGLCCR
jgi:hypothetical protein